MRKGRVMSIIFHESSNTFHLYNNDISYIICVLPNGHLGNLYLGKRIHDREDMKNLLCHGFFSQNRDFQDVHLEAHT